MTRDELIETMADIIQGKRYSGAMWSSEEISVNLLAAIEAAGLAIVPVEATQEVADSVDFGDSQWMVRLAYRAMIEAGRL